MLKRTTKATAVAGALMMIMGVMAPITTKTVDADNITGTVTASSLNVRSGASTSHSVVGSVSKGTEVEILSSNNGWYEIEYANNKTGWSSGDYITKGSASTSSQTGTVTATSLNVRNGSSTSHSVLGKLSKGTTVTIVETSNGWHKIEYSNHTRDRKSVV